MNTIKAFGVAPSGGENDSEPKKTTDDRSGFEMDPGFSDAVNFHYILEHISLLDPIGDVYGFTSEYSEERKRDRREDNSEDNSENEEESEEEIQEEKARRRKMPSDDGSDLEDSDFKFSNWQETDYENQEIIVPSRFKMTMKEIARTLKDIRVESVCCIGGSLSTKGTLHITGPSSKRIVVGKGLIGANDVAAIYDLGNDAPYGDLKVDDIALKRRA